MAPFTPLEWFRHRPTLDGSFDSICPQCFVRIATACTEAELGKYETRHICHELEPPDAVAPPRNSKPH